MIHDNKTFLMSSFQWHECEKNIKPLAWIPSASILRPYISAARALATAPASLRSLEATNWPNILI